MSSDDLNAFNGSGLLPKGGPPHEAYLDNNATTALLPEVRDAIVSGLDAFYGNPSSRHQPGAAARRMVEAARVDIARALRARHPSEIIFTSCATESIAQAFRSAVAAERQIIHGAADHNAVFDSALRASSRRVVVSVGPEGRVCRSELVDALAAAPSFVSITLVNNETGVLEDVAAIAKACRRAGALLHVDAAQAVGRVEIDLRSLDCDYASFSPHKFHGPKGVGLLYARRGAPRAALIGGHQQEGLRGGTENVTGIIGAGVAVAMAVHSGGMADFVRRQRDRLEQALLKSIPGATVNGALADRAPNVTNICFPGRNAGDLVAALSRRGVYVSAAAACSTGGQPSHVLCAMGLEHRANSSVRFSLSRFTTPPEVDYAVDQVRAVVAASLPLADPRGRLERTR
jgi:cysteine desulfurase